MGINNYFLETARLLDSMNDRSFFDGRQFNGKVYESDDEFNIEFDCPGVKDRKDISIKANSDGFVEISAKRNERTCKDGEKCIAVFGDCAKQELNAKIRIRNIDAEKVKAKYEDGVIYVTIAKKTPDSKKEVCIAVE